MSREILLVEGSAPEKDKARPVLERGEEDRGHGSSYRVRRPARTALFERH